MLDGYKYNLGLKKLKDVPAVYGFLDNSIDFKSGEPGGRMQLKNMLTSNFNGANFEILELEQIHGSKIINIKQNNYDPLSQPQADGFVTGRSGLLLCIKTADCIPVLFYDKSVEMVAALHCGWRGLFDGIIFNFGSILKNSYGLSLKNTVAMIGPSICKNCYEVKKDFYNNFINKDPGNKNFFNGFSHDKNGFLFDLKELLKNHLIGTSFEKNNIYDINICNYEDHNFFSFRRDRTDSRFVSFIGLMMSR